MAAIRKNSFVTRSQLNVLNIYGVFSALLLFLYAIQLFEVNTLRIGALDRFMDRMDSGGGIAQFLMFILGANIFLSPLTLGILAFLNFKLDRQSYRLLGTFFIASVVVFLFGLAASRH